MVKKLNRENSKKELSTLKRISVKSALKLKGKFIIRKEEYV